MLSDGTVVKLADDYSSSSDYERINGLNDLSSKVLKIESDNYGDVWVVDVHTSIYKCFRNDDADLWVQMYGRAIDIGIGDEGSIWIIDTYG